MSEVYSIKEILDKGGTYTGLTMGTSMWPLIRQHRDNIIVVNEKDCFITVKITNEPSSFEELDKMKYCSFTIELPKNEKTDKIEKVYFR